jgi:predicted CxxxxCH...CXXCH cytochrome family protein
MLTTDVCEACHSVTTWKPATKADHSQMPAAVAGTCNTCHSGTLTISTGVVQGKPADAIHQGVTAQCGTCHATSTWLGATFSHTGMTTGCVSCHNGTTATGKSATHLSSSNLCENCHNTTAWKPATTFDHTQTSVTACYTCHSGTVAISTGYVTGKPGTHIATTNKCENCHTSSGWKPAFAVDHTQIPEAVAGTCNTCHNGVQATGMPKGHVTTTAECGTCHKTLAWLPATFNHTGVTSGCAGCHDGVGATGKSSTHFITTRECNYCHSTTAWTPLTFKHASANYPGDHRTALTCTNSACHGGNSEAVTWRSPAYAGSCAGCHQANFEPDPHTHYGSTKYTVSELRNCSGACHIYSNATLTTITTRRNGPQHRVTDSAFSN